MRTFILFVLGAAAFLKNDTLVLKNGQQVVGIYLGGDARTVKFDAADRIATYAVSDVEAMRFSSSPETAAGPSSSPIATAPSASLRRSTLQVATNTPITVRLIDPIRSDEAAAGSVYRASVDVPVSSNGHTAIPAYAPAVVQLLDRSKSGHIAGKTTLSLALTKIEMDGGFVQRANHRYRASFQQLGHRLGGNNGRYRCPGRNCGRDRRWRTRCCDRSRFGCGARRSGLRPPAGSESKSGLGIKTCVSPGCAGNSPRALKNVAGP